MARLILLVGIWVAVIVNATPSRSERRPVEPAFSTEQAGFEVKYKSESSPYRVNAVFLMPGEELLLEALGGAANDSFEARAGTGRLIVEGPRNWRWHAPFTKGVYELEISRNEADRILFNAFVLVPATKMDGESLYGYRVGQYPKTPLRALKIYEPPAGFVEVTEANRQTMLSPHFSLEQFLCKQEGGYPKYVVLRERLLLKLELVLERVNREGHHTPTFEIMSGYRTPHYNQAIGNVRYSRHVWGGAADIFIDVQPRDGVMDDLNRDGRSDHRDADALYELVDGLFGKPFYRFFIGGLGRYKANAVHGPFVHLDVRGFRARWGT